jgi:hypothetical protein
MQRKGVTPSTRTRKRRKKSSFRYSTMKQLENARKYKRLKNKDNIGRRKDTKPTRQSKRLLQMSQSVLESDEQKGLRTPTPFNEFEVYGASTRMDIEDEEEDASAGSIKAKVISDIAF